MLQRFILLLVPAACCIILWGFSTITSTTYQSTVDPLSSSDPITAISFKVLPGLTFNRNIEQLSPDWVSKVSVDFYNHCSTSDEYGGNHCHYEWGESVSMDVTSCNITIPLTDAVIFHGSFKVDLVVDWEFSCRACGQDCTITLPVTNEELVIPMPSCPLDNKNLPRHVQVKLDDSSPTNGIPTQMHGHVLVTVENIDEVIADVALSVWIK